MKNLKNIHTDFTLNGNIFTSESALLTYSKTISIEIYSFLTDWFSDKNTITVKTSGSTGKPKVIQLQKEHIYNSALATGTFFNLKEKTTALLCLPPNFIAGKMMLIRALILGWHLDVVNPNSHPLDGNNKHYDFCAMIPLQVQNSLTELFRIKKLIIGGATISNTLLEKLKPIKIDAYETYGMTETITHIAVKKLNHNTLINDRFESSFKTLPNVSILKDSRGCLVIKAPKVSGSDIVTNDLVEIIDSTHFKWLGRYDTIINSGAVKIIPEAAERKLASLFPFRFFIAGLPDIVLGEKVVLVCESKSQEIDKFQIEKRLLKYECPKQIIFVNRFVETATKKVNRKETLKFIKKN
ncbi:MAG: AMP-binding protein [Flavobacteriaceae bacterium]|nr:AMP-binding protein [Flavobacteriaceae bacterium]